MNTLFFFKVVGDALGVLIDQQTTPNKLYRGAYDPQKNYQNENPQRWIDSQLNSESFKTDFKLK